MRELKGPHYLNVDLEVWSREDLAPFVEALESRSVVLHVGEVQGKFHASFEAIGGGGQTSREQTIRALLKLVKDLPPVARRLWRGALSRELNVGYSGGEVLNLVHERPIGSGCWYAKNSGNVVRAYETSLSPEILRAVADVKGTIAVTIYPAARQAQARRPKKAPRLRQDTRHKVLKATVGRKRSPAH
jgi:hypothetical protein